MIQRRLIIPTLALATAAVFSACSESENTSQLQTTVTPVGAVGTAPVITQPAGGVPNQTATPASGTGAATAVPATGTPAATAANTAPPKLNLNIASAEQFKTIPGVGDRFVREFNEYRPYTSIAQFRRELGKYVPQDQVTEWEKYLFVPIDRNAADAATIQQIPGINAATAQQLIDARPYSSNQEFLTKLQQLVPQGQVAVAGTMLTN